MSVLNSQEYLSSSKETSLQILRYWHQLEFFMPFNLDEVLSGTEIDLPMHVLMDENANKILPWIKEEPGLFHYQLYLLPFDKKALTRISNQHFPLEFQNQNDIEMEEKLDDEGLTCFARLFIDSNGTVRWNGLSISTMPWAMGMLQSGNYGKLSEISFEKDMILLKSALKVLENQYENIGKFDAVILLNLLKIFFHWANFKPDYPFVVTIKPIPAKNKSQVIPSLPANLPVPLNKINEIQETVQEENEDQDILNSFYIQDLEKVLNYMKNNEHSILESYINGCSEKKDVLSIENQSLVLKKLQPQQFTTGRWPATDSHRMSLLQQLFINHCFDSSEKNSIYATNGPPGTGKTTLLKDIIAENIVKRAEELAKFSSIAACFQNKKTVASGDKTFTIYPLAAQLTGFEMLVVSSNNTAVENISLELPLKKELGDLYQETCHYLQPVAAKLAARHTQYVNPLNPEKKPWGLIAVALGKSANRQTFVERFFFPPEGKSHAKNRIQKGEYLTIWEWRDHYKGCSFGEARERFLKSLATLDKYQNELQEFAELHDAMLQNNWEIQCEPLMQDLAIIEQEMLELEYNKKQLQESMIETEKYQNTLSGEIEKHLIFKPSFFQKILKTNKSKTFNQIMQQLQIRSITFTEELLKIQNQITQLNSNLQEKRKKSQTIKNQLQKLVNQQKEANDKYLELQSRFSTANIPKTDIHETDHVYGYWQSETFNQLRTNVFIQALQLHEAWLAEALKNKYFGGNLSAINHLMDGKHPLPPSDELIIWQSLFMIIPVISSTFASIGRQFKNIGAQSIGWLLIDEAGQGIPQAATGALWRSKKVIVVGDPRQIEPIMTLPPHLIEGISKHHLPMANHYWSPHLSSIQKLADQASSLGSIMLLNQHREWIGLPLLVHRRCLEPMFSIANEIAYENKMINARLSPNNQELPPSIWFDVEGTATDRQFVPRQGECLLQLFIWFYNHDRGLPGLFIITPFRRIRKHLKDLIQNQDNWHGKINPGLPAPTKKELFAWTHKNIGTVHTFQGKESRKVIFVLGADKEQKGAVRWASSKPNLLNVALTRAKDRIYIIGEWDLWANERYFSTASAVLKRKIFHDKFY